MALDVHIAGSSREAARKAPDMQLEEHVHERIFAALSAHKADLPGFWRLSDYYGDATFLPDQVPRLAADTRKAIGLVADPVARETLRQLERACIEAMDRSLSVYVFCD